MKLNQIIDVKKLGVNKSKIKSNRSVVNNYDFLLYEIIYKGTKKLKEREKISSSTESSSGSGSYDPPPPTPPTPPPPRRGSVKKEQPGPPPKEKTKYISRQ